MEFSNNIPIYQQIMDVIKAKIISGELQCGERIQSVRELAQNMSVNPNTMQKALAALEHDGLLVTERTSGKYVTSDTKIIAKLKTEMINQTIRDFFLDMEKLGVDKIKVLNAIETYMKGDREIE